jgi:hypothetical protein
MSEQAPREVLAELSILRQRLAILEGNRHRARTARRLLPLVLAALLVALVPLAALAANPFNDLTGGVHDPNIDAIYNAGITRGCDPDVSYCPTGLVTREEMASFLARTAGIGGNPPVANAKTAQTATNANQLGGVPANAYALKSEIGGGGTGPTTLRYSFAGLPERQGPSLYVIHESGAYNGAAVTTTPRTRVELPPLSDAFDLALPLAYPAALSGTTLRVSAVQVCYAIPLGTSGAAIVTTSLVMNDQGQASQILLDTTPRQAATPSCYEVTVPTPVAGTGALYLRLRVINSVANYAGTIFLHSVRLTLIP